MHRNLLKIWEFPCLSPVGVIFGIFVIYFNSVGTTSVIIGSIPFGIVGVLFALMSHGMPLSFMTYTCDCRIERKHSCKYFNVDYIY